MSIDRLNKAATAAGFAMATPEEPDVADIEVAAEDGRAASRALVLSPPPSEHTREPFTVARVTTWLKGFVPGYVGRLPA